MKETKITAPDGCEIEKVEIIDGVAVVTFREKERKLPKSWEEFCEMYPIKAGECYMSATSNINEIRTVGIRSSTTDRYILPDSATAEAVLALCQLIQLRNCFNREWVPDWTNDRETKFVIRFLNNEIYKTVGYESPTPLYFKTAELRDEFLRYFRPLIDKLEPLYGIKEGGSEC